MRKEEPINQALINQQEEQLRHLESLQKYEVQELIILTTPKIWDIITKNGYIDYLQNCYRQARINLLTCLYGSPDSETATSHFPEQCLEIKIVIIDKDDFLFENLYHNPKRFDSLPDWVIGYVNSVINVYVITNYNNTISGVDKTAHEMTHLISFNYVRMMEHFLSLNDDPSWNPFIAEAIAVAPNQMLPIPWLKNQVMNADKPISLKAIQKRGVWYFSKKGLPNNFAYQYLTHLAEFLGEKLRSRHTKKRELKLGPFFYLLELVRNSSGANMRINEYLVDKGIDIEQIDAEFRSSLGLTH